MRGFDIVCKKCGSINVVMYIFLKNRLLFQCQKCPLSSFIIAPKPTSKEKARLERIMDKLILRD